jgi:hypothetical protein
LQQFDEAAAPAQSAAAVTRLPALCAEMQA